MRQNLFCPLQDDLCTLPNAKFMGKSMFKTSFLHPSENGRLQKDILMPPSTGALRKRPGMFKNQMSGTSCPCVKNSYHALHFLAYVLIHMDCVSSEACILIDWL